jgi:hypothetical protein
MMAATPMTAAEKNNLPVLDFAIPGFRNDSNTHPFNIGASVSKYRVVDLAKEESRSDRTDWFSKLLFLIWKETKASVPYAFKSRDGTIRSLDAGCLGHLLNRSRPELEVETDPNGYIIAARPATQLIARCEDIGIERLRSRFGLEIPSPPLPPLQDSEDLGPNRSGLEEELPLALDLGDPVDERRKVEAERVIREGASEFRKDLMLVWGGFCAITRTAVPEVLEAAHIYRYLGPRTNDPRNGFLLRADVHRLFDRNLICIHYIHDRLIVDCSLVLTNSNYAQYHSADLPRKPTINPDYKLVEHRYRQFLEEERARRRD